MKRSEINQALKEPEAMCAEYRFNPPVGHFPTIEEDEPPYRLQCNKYPEVK